MRTHIREPQQLARSRELSPLRPASPVNQDESPPTLTTIQNAGHSFSAFRVISEQTVAGEFGQGGARSPANVRAKLEISRPGDPYEEEADQVADHVMDIVEPDGGTKTESSNSAEGHEFDSGRFRRLPRGAKSSARRTTA